MAEFPVDVDADAALQEYHLACEVLHADGKAALTFPLTLEGSTGPGYLYLPLIVILVVIAAVAAFLVVRNRHTRTLRRRRLWR